MRIGEAISGISEELTDIGVAIDRAENKTAQLQARASAIDELMATGVLADATLPAGGSEVDRELQRLTSASTVEAELARMKAELGQGPSPKQLESGR